jgi:hypothetical protein
LSFFRTAGRTIHGELYGQSKKKFGGAISFVL